MSYSNLFYLIVLLQLVNLSIQQCTKTSTVKSGDYCWLIANNNGIDVATLQALNPGINCNNLQIGQVVCVSTYVAPTTQAPTLPPTVSPTCTYPYVIKSGDTCWQLQNTYGIDSVRFNALNPGINCNNLQVGQVVCLSNAVVTTAAPVVTTVAPIVTTAAPIVTTPPPIVTTPPPIVTTPPPIVTAAPTTLPPTTLAPVVTTASAVLCQRAYLVQSGDYCALIARYNGLTMEQFYALNPGINCANLQPNQAVCVESFGSPVVTTAPPTLAPVVTTLAPVVTTVAPVVTTVAPVVTTVAPVVTTVGACYCANPYIVKSGDYCYKIMADNAVDQTTFYNMNPGVNCNNLQIGSCVCLPVKQACSSTYTVKSGDYCWLIMNNYGLTEAQFYALNPGINCNNLQVGQLVKVRAC